MEISFLMARCLVLNSSARCYKAITVHPLAECLTSCRGVSLRHLFFIYLFLAEPIDRVKTTILVCSWQLAYRGRCTFNCSGRTFSSQLGDGDVHYFSATAKACRGFPGTYYSCSASKPLLVVL